MDVRVRVVRRRRDRGGGHPAALAALGVLGGFALGFVVWSRGQVAWRRALFSPRPLRRLAALGYLAGRPPAETMRLLQDYVRWESLLLLRRRAERLLERAGRRLDRHVV